MARVDKLLELMEKEYGAKPMIYTSEKLYKTHFDIKKYKKYHYFIANYKREPSMAYTLWQYTQRGKLKGIAGFVDFSKFHKKYDVETIKIKKKTAAAQASQDTTATNKTVKDEKTPQPAANANKPTGKSTQTSKSSTK